MTVNHGESKPLTSVHGPAPIPSLSVTGAQAMQRPSDVAEPGIRKEFSAQVAVSMFLQADAEV